MEKQLYVLLFEERIPKGRGKVHVVPREEYVHATDNAHARALFSSAYPDIRRWRLLETGLAIGHFCDEHGENRSADSVVHPHMLVNA